MTSSVPSSATALIGSSTLTRLLSCTQVVPATERQRGSNL